MKRSKCSYSRFFYSLSVCLFFAIFCVSISPVATYAVLGHENAPRTILGGQNDPFRGYPLLRRIASCESTGDVNGTPRQFLPDGSVLLGQTNKDDIGELQINTHYWLKKAQSLGYDIYTQAGNIKMGKWIFDRYGSSPWNWSRRCWKP